MQKHTCSPIEIGGLDLMKSKTACAICTYSIDSGWLVVFLLTQKREVLRRQEEERKRREDERKNALKLSNSYSERHYESAMDKITKAAARSEHCRISTCSSRGCWQPHQGTTFKEHRDLRGKIEAFSRFVSEPHVLLQGAHSLPVFLDRPYSS